ncbi:MAG: ankyrin repeat domain-containing protein [Armatimonadetes bacterium]|nr:ankyrin repeat domain-containing protein [Akkermansiaceae bacterium]
MEKELKEAGYEMTAAGWFGAIGGNDVAVMEKMVDGGFAIETKDVSGNNGLHVAAGEGAQKAAGFLLNRGFSIDEPGAGGRTALMMAVVADKVAMVKWLLGQGADPKVKDGDGFMALMLAVTNGREGSIEELAQYHREDLDAALLLASLTGKAGVIDALTNYGASVYARMEDGRTPLMLAAENGHSEAVAMLIDIGASRFATTEDGDTAQSFALAGGHEEIAKMIETGVVGESLALDTDEEVAMAMDNYLEESRAEPEEISASGSAGETVSQDGVGKAIGVAKVQAAGSSGRIAAVTLAGARIGRPKSMPQGEVGKETTIAADAEELPLVMRHYRERELPVEVKRVSGGVASIHLAGSELDEIELRAGDKVPGSSLVVVSVLNRMEEGKLNNGEPVEVGVVEVADQERGRQREWLTGRPAVSHDPVAMVEDASTGQRYLAKPGQKFSSEDGREFIVNDVRPNQLVIEEVATGEASTLHLRGPRG